MTRSVATDQAVFEVHACDPAEARPIWRRCLEGLDDPARYFGPDVVIDLHPGDRYYRLTVDSQDIGLGWVRKFTPGGHIRSYGHAFYREARGRGFAVGVSTAMLRRVFREYPETTTIIAMIYSSNPDQRWRLTKEGRRRPARYVGEILSATADHQSLHIVQIERPRSPEEFQVIRDEPEPEMLGAPHSHAKETP